MTVIKYTIPTGVYSYEKRALDSQPFQPGTFTGPANFIEMYSGSSAPMPINTDVDDGHAWFMDKSWYTPTIANVSTNYYKGPVFAGGIIGQSGLLVRPSYPTEQQLKSHGTTMVSRCLPNDPAADTSVTVAEILREGVPSLIGLQTMRNRTQVARNAGGEYLNIEFGWKPLVSGVRDLAKAVKAHEKIWLEYRKGSDRKTRVGHHLEDVKNTKIFSGDIGPNPSVWPRFLRGTLSQSSRSHIWFSGAFKYYVPEPVGYSDKMQYWSSQASKVLGLRLDPEVLWNLAPWSWAVDWFTNTGDLLHNISLLGKDGLVMQYGYAMSEQKVENYTSAYDPVEKFACGLTHVNKICRRVQANPYGFSVDLVSLSARQTAIVAALGLSKT
jgi:hypothetical protein